MKKKEIIDKILQYHPNIEHYHGCDEYKSGFEEEKCTGIVSALVPTMEVLKKAVELGCNLLVVHEPIYYQTPDFPDWKGDFENSVQKEKETSVYKGYKQDKIEMRGDRAEMSDFPLYLNTVAGGLDRRDQTIGGFSFVVKIYAVPVIEIIG